MDKPKLKHTSNINSWTNSFLLSLEQSGHLNSSKSLHCWIPDLPVIRIVRRSVIQMDSSTPLYCSGMEASFRSNIGIGISFEIKEKIFQPFFTTKPTLGQGTGLGLSISYEIITKGHGGGLKVETIEKQGTTFIINIPINN